MTTHTRCKQLFRVLTCLVLTATMILCFLFFHSLPSPKHFGDYIAPDSDYTPVSIQEIPKELQWAMVAIEDPSFYSSSLELDGVSILRSLWLGLQYPRARCPCPNSSIPLELTTQLLIVSRPDDQGSFQNHLKHLVLVVFIAQRYTHEEILEFYLNTIRYGQDIYGVEAAAQAYFGKSVDQLGLAESALLVAVRRVHPDSRGNFDRIRRRQSTVLNQMVEYGYISEEEAEKAKEEHIMIQDQNKDKGQ